MFFANQEIALRGHREGTSLNKKGNFLELIDLLAIYDPVVRDQLAHGPHNARYTSHTIQNQMLMVQLLYGLVHNVAMSCIDQRGEKVRNHICDLVHSAGVFSIIVDESKDFAKQEQMNFVVRFADMAKGEIHEHFLMFVEAKSLDATGLSTYCTSKISLLGSV